MIQEVEKYAKMVGNLEIPKSVLEQALGIFQAVPEIMQDFSNPANDLAAKHNVIDRVFPTQIRSFLKLLCDNDAVSLFPEILRHTGISHRRKKDPFAQYCAM